MKTKLMILITGVVLIALIMAFYGDDLDIIYEDYIIYNLDGQMQFQLVELGDYIGHDSGLMYRINSNGLIEIINNGAVISYVGFGVTGNVGAVTQIKTSQDYLWDLEQDGDIYTVTNNDADFIWVTELDMSGDYVKSTHRITNKLGTDITDSKFWYIQTIPEETSLRYNGKVYSPSFDKSNVHFTDLDGKDVGTRILVNNDYIMDFSDLIQNNFNITEVFIGNGSILGHPTKLIMALGVTKNNGLFKDSTTVVLDPQWLNTSELFPDATGTFENDWANHANLKADDGALSQPTTDGDTVTVSNFSILESEGGPMPNNFAKIMSIEINIDTDNTCIGMGGEYDLNVSLSGDGGVTYTELRGELFECGMDLKFLGGDVQGGFGDEDVWGKLDWKESDFKNGNFVVKVNMTDTRTFARGTITENVDYVSLRIAYTDPLENNITYSLLNTPQLRGEIVFHLAPSNKTAVINESNIVIYSPFNYDDEVTSLPFAVPNYDLRVNEGAKATQLALNRPVFLQDKGIFGSALNFSLGGVIGTIRSKRIFYGGPLYLYDPDELTICEWVKREEPTTTHNGTIFSRSETPSIFHYKLRLAPGSSANPILSLTNTSGAIGECEGIGGAVANGVWTHVCGVYNGSQLRVYTGGTVRNTCDTLTGPLKKGGPSRITTGCSTRTIGGGLVNDCFIGVMDELIVLNTALTNTQISLLSDNKTAVLYPSGTREFKNQDFGSDNRLNITSTIQVPNGTYLNVSIGNSTAGDYVYHKQIDYTSGTANDIILGTPENISVRFHFFANSDQLTSPLLNGSTLGSIGNNVLSIPFFPITWRADSCAYDGGDYNLIGTDNCTVLGDNSIDAGSNVTITQCPGLITLFGNITGWFTFFKADDCDIMKVDGGIISKLLLPNLRKVFK